MSSQSTNKAAEAKETKAITVEKAAAPKAAAVEPEGKKEEKKTVLKAAPAVEEKPAKKAATVKKPAAKKEKVEKTELKPEVFVEYQGNTASETQVIERIKAAYVAEGHRASSIKSLRIYIKPEEGKAYYVLNEKSTGDVNLY